MCVKEEELSAYLDGETSLSQRAAIAAHLQECEECREKLDSLKTLSGFFGKEKIDEAALAKSREKIKTRLDHLGLPGMRERSILRKELSIPLPLAAAALFAVIFLGSLLAIKSFTPNGGGSLPVITSGEYVQEMNTLVKDKDSLPREESTLDQLLRMLENEGASVEVRIELPVKSKFSVQGEPQLLRAADFQGGGER